MTADVVGRWLGIVLAPAVSTPLGQRSNSSATNETKWSDGQCHRHISAQPDEQ